MRAIVYILAGLLVGASGDIIYEAFQQAEVSGSQAATAADWFIARGAWLGDRSDIRRCVIERYASSSTGYRAWCIGDLSAPAASVPDGAVMHGVEP